MKQILSKSLASAGAAVFLLLLLILSSFFSGAEVHASKPGMEVCSNCHTMHNSESGQSMRMDSTSIIGAGSGECLDCHADNRAVLLRMDCIGCHTFSSGSSIEPQTKTPQVVHNSVDLAAGNFRHVFNFNDRRGHNVHGFGFDIGAGDLGNFPPGYNRAFDPSDIGYDQYNPRAQIMCAGANGCHGNRDRLSQIDAMKGAHHAIDSMLKAATFSEDDQVKDSGTGNKVGTSYRMLLGVRGIEDNDWELTKSSTDHNEYKGRAYVSRTGQNWAAIETMSDFCAECHGNFHNSGGLESGSSPWYRHPVDVLLPASGEYSLYTEYNPAAPVARLDLAGSIGSHNVVQGNAVVMCLSCHRAHASPYEKILRWDYKNSNLASAISGCAVCHTSMD